MHAFDLSEPREVLGYLGVVWNSILGAEQAQFPEIEISQIFFESLAFLVERGARNVVAFEFEFGLGEDG